MSVCNHDCFHCPHPDCIDDEITASEYREKLDDYIAPKNARQRRIAAKQREYYEANRDAIAAKQREYREANRDAIAAKQREYREANRERYNAYMRRYMAARRARMGVH